MESLEPRHLLAAVSFVSASGQIVFDADAGEADAVLVSSPGIDQIQILVGNGDQLTLIGDAVGNPAFQLTQSVIPGDTLTIDTSGINGNGLTFNLSDLDDVFTATDEISIPNVIVNGGDGNDSLDASGLNTSISLFGQAGNDTLTGGASDDTLGGGGGTDIIAGNDGIDTNTFIGIGVGVTATVNADGTGTASYGSVNENFTGIENLTGTDNDDILIATGAAPNILLGLAGDDILAGGGGTDTIDGGAGVDTNSFAGIGVGVTATINADGSGSAFYGQIVESFSGIENLIGSDNDDTLTGNLLANTIEGGLGNDQINGLGGDDFLFGGSGDDTIEGGEGNDRLIGGLGSDQIFGGLGDDSLVGAGQIEITLQNLAPIDGVSLSPVVVTTQDGIYDQFDIGSAAPENIERLAEDGLTDPRIAAALASGGVGQALATDAGPLAPGETRTLTFFADPSDPLTQFISFAAQVLPSNDAFIGNDDPTAIDLFDDQGSLIRRVGGSVFIVNGNEVLDAGTEVNDEIPGNTAGLAQSVSNTGVAEGGVIGSHPGFQGSIGFGGPVGNILTAVPNGDFLIPNMQILSIAIDAAIDGDDLLSGGQGNDVLSGGEGDDLLFGDEGDDTLLGGDGDDLLAGNVGTDVIDGGIGLDTNAFSGINVGVTATINEDNTGTASYGLVNESFTSIENLTGSPAADTLTGNSQSNVIDGGLGDDTIFGLDGNDFLFGGSGVDTINGGLGNDRLVGGFGDDNLFGNQGDDTLIGNGQIEVTLTNLSPDEGSSLSPVVVATQNGLYDQFDIGSAASENIERLAEDGTTDARIAAALGSGGVFEALATTGGLIAPGEERTLTFFVDPVSPLTQFLSFASSLLPSNDAFIGNDDPTQIPLFDASGTLIRRVGTGAVIVSGSDVLDAGTEVNDELLLNTAGLGQLAPDTGVTENGVISVHPGFLGSAGFGGAIGNVLTAQPGSDFTLPGVDLLSLEVDDAARQLGFTVTSTNQPLASLTTAQNPQQLIAEAINNNLYYNVHTNSFPTGEIRGQLLLQSDVTVNGIRTVTLSATLDSAQEPGGSSDSAATGVGTVTIVDDGTFVTYSSTLQVTGIATTDLLPVSGFSAIHLHNAPAGVNGPIITDIVQDAGGDISGNATSAAADTGDGDVFVESLESDNDTLTGGGGSDTLIGNGGNDLIRGGGGNDNVIGGSGNDILNGGGGNDILQGGSGDDLLIGGDGTDQIEGGAGTDTNSFEGTPVSLTAVVNADGSGTADHAAVNESFTGIEDLIGTSNDDILTATGNAENLLRGLAGDDVINGGGGDDFLIGDEGADTLIGGSGNDIQLGGTGNDTLFGNDGDDILRGDDGDDFLNGASGTDAIFGDAGIDINSFSGLAAGVTVAINDDGSGTAQYDAVFEVFAGIETLVGTSQDDVLMVNGSRDTVLNGLEGNDLLIGGLGNDTLIGGAGNDTINALAGNDVLLGGLGNDTLQGNNGDDVLQGNEGNDTLVAGNGDDSLIGGDGNDTLFGNAGLDFIFGQAGADSLFGGNGIDDLFGGDGDDLLVGGAEIDVLDGGLGNDQEIQ